MFVVVLVILATANFAAHSLRCFPGVTWPKTRSSKKKVVGATREARDHRTFVFASRFAERYLKNTTCFVNILISRAPRIPDMILSAFDVKIQAINDGMPPKTRPGPVHLCSVTLKIAPSKVDMTRTLAVR